MSPAGDAVRDVLQRGHAAWPDIELGRHADGFAEHVEARLPAGAAGHEDLYLAYACVVGIDAAVRRFESAYRSLLEVTHATWRGPRPDLEDFTQSVYERALVGSPPRIASYRGRGPLRAWVKMVAVRRLADLAHRARRDAPHPATRELVDVLLPGLDLARDLMQQRHQPVVQAAIRSAFATLTPAQRIVLRQRFLHGLSLAELARLGGIHRVTVSKQIARARERVLDALTAELSTSRVTAQEAKSLARLCLSQLDVSLGTLLRSRSLAEVAEPDREADRTLDEG